MNESDKKYVPESLGKRRLNSSRRPVDIDKIPEDPHPNPTTRILNKLVLLALLLIALGVVTVLYWSFAKENVLQVNNSPFPVRTIREHPTADGVIILTVDLCKTMDVKGVTRTSFVGESREIFLPMSEEKLPVGCLKNREVPVLIPKDTPAGTYKIKFRVVYDINPVKKQVVNEFESRPFIIDPPSPTRAAQ